MFGISSVARTDDDDDVFVPKGKIMKRKHVFKALEEEDLEELMKKEASSSSSSSSSSDSDSTDEEVEGEKVLEEEEEEDIADQAEPLPFRELGEFLLKHFKSNTEKKPRDLEFEHPQTKEKYIIHVLKFYNTLGDIPVKIRIRNKTFIFKQVNSMYPDFYAMNVYRKLNEHWGKNGIKAKIVTYDIVPLALSVEFKGKKEFCFCGFIHFCEGHSMMNIKQNELLKLILNDPKRNGEEILSEFLSSLVGSTIGNLITGLQDRHQYNVLLTPDTRICHIDLNAVFGEQLPVHERVGLIAAPSLYFPGSISGFLKHEKIDAMGKFRKEIVSAFNCLPEFDEIAAVLGHEQQMKFVHGRIHSWTAKKIFDTMTSSQSLFNKDVRDFFQKEIMMGGPSELKLSDDDDFVHIVCKNIFRVTKMGLTQMEHKDNWGSVKPVFARNEEEGSNEVFLISNFSGHIHCYNWEKSNFRVVSRQDWGSSRGMIYHEGYLYICRKKLFKMNVEDGCVKILTPLKWASRITSSAVLHQKLYMFEKGSNIAYVFDPSVPIVSRIVVSNVEKFPIGRNTIGSNEHNCIYFFNPGCFTLGMEDKMKMIRRASKEDWNGTKAAVSCGEDVLVIQNEDMILWNPQKDTKKKLSYKLKWGNTSLAF